jgi:hypothetical protein
VDTAKGVRVLEVWFENRVVAWAGIAVATVVLIFCAPALPSRLVDVPGVYVVGDVPDCAKTYCYSHAGKFTSDDGEVTLTSAFMGSKLHETLKQGDRVRAYYTGTEEVQDSTNSKGWRHGWPIIGSILAVILLALALQGFWMSREPRKAD